jgi:hypothetical protein
VSAVVTSQRIGYQPPLAPLPDVAPEAEPVPSDAK